MPKDMQIPDKLEEQYVHQVYRQIAGHFNHSRYKPWPRVKQFINCLPPGSVVADIGCGDGKYSTVNDNIYMVGCDVCPELIQVAKERTNDVVLADNLILPFRDNVFDAILSIAVIHHMCTEERRLQALQEMCRITKPGALIIICVWAMEQTQRSFGSQDVLVPWHLHLQPSFSKLQSTDSQTDLNQEGVTKCVLNKVEDKLTTAERVIGGSVGIEPISPQNGLNNEKAATSILSSLQSRVGKGLEKLWTISPLLSRKKQSNNTMDKSVSEQKTTCSSVETVDMQKVPPPAVPTHTQSTLSTGQNLVNGIVRLSPRIGRRIAHYMGYNEQDADPIEEYAEKLAVTIIEQALDELVYGGMKNDHEGSGSDSKYGPTYYRYYHVYKEGELDDLVKQVAQLQIVDSFYDHANWCVIARKCGQ